jgi:hypothetical protein
VSDEECPLSDLPASQCACPKHRGGTAPGEEPIETSGQPFQANYRSACARRCENGINPGDMIMHVATQPGDLFARGYVHYWMCVR